MPSFDIMQVDAFTNVPLEGNPCAIVFEADPLEPDQMQAIAREMNLSETAFVLVSENADVRARYFTPAEEIPMAGHPTIAAIFALIDSGRLHLKHRRTTIHLELEAGVIPVEITIDETGQQRISMTQLAPDFLNTYAAEDVMPVFGLSDDDVLPDAPIQTVSTGTPQLMVPLKSLESLSRARVNIEAYIQLRAEGDFFSPHLFCVEGLTPEANTFARHFGTPPDTLEDPFTGSATGGMAAYLWHYGLIDSPDFIAQQGHWMNRPGTAFVDVIGPPNDIQGVKVSGQAVTVMRGKITI